MKTHPLTFSLPGRATALVTALALTFGPSGVLPGFMATTAQAASAKKSGGTVTLNFVNAEIEGVARAMAVIVDKQIIVDPRVKGAITLYSDQPLTPREAYLNFLAALRGQGFSLVEVGGMLKILPEAEAKLQSGTVGDQVLTQIFRLQFESAANLVTVLRPLISPNNTINANATTNALVITDYADNLKRLSQMIAALDVPSSTDMEAIPLQYAIASDLAPMVQKLADGGASAAVPGAPAGASGALVMADPRTNTLMVRAPNAARMALVRSLIQRLDTPGTAGLGGSGIHVVYLRNADAVKLAQVLRAAFPGSGGSSGGSSGGTSTGAGSTPTASTGTATTSASTGSSTGASAQATAPVGASAQPSTGGFIQADPSTNSLIITASDALYRQLRAVIDQLDGRRAQIYIEAMIVEVSEQKLAEAGFQWAGGVGNNNQLVAGTNLAQGDVVGLFSLIGAAKTVASGVKGLNVAFGHKLADGTYSLGALASFLETNADGNVLSKPNMIALDNEEAKIVVGQNVPFVTGSYSNSNSGSSGTVNPFTTVERKDVGLTLRVRPQVGEGGTVRMTVFQENSSVDASSKSNSTGLTTNKSSIETTVVIDDGATLVLGGLLKDEFSNGDTQVPLLGDIPVLGNLFKSRSRSRNKTNLMVFLRPVVIRNQDDSNALTSDRYDFMRQKQVNGQPEPSVVLNKVDGAPVMDPLKLSNKLTMPPDVSKPTKPVSLDKPMAP
jgi:general secretion pathway protein D